MVFCICLAVIMGTKIDYIENQNIVQITDKDMKLTLKYDVFYSINNYARNQTVSDFFNKSQWIANFNRSTKAPYNYILELKSKNKIILIDSQKIPKGIL